MPDVEIPAKYKVEEVKVRKEILELPIASPYDKPIKVNLGPSHPAMHGTIKMIAELVGETVVNIDVEPGFLHRGFEKMMEHHNYVTAIPYTDRLNYVSAFINNFGYVETIEKLFSIEITERCAWLRTLFSELSRITDHYTCQAAICSELGAMTPFLYLMQARDFIWEHFNWATGARQTYSYARIGGLAKDIPDGWLDRLKEILRENIPLLKDVHGLMNKNKIFL